MSSWQKNWRRKWRAVQNLHSPSLTFLGAVWLHQGCILTSSIKILPSLLFLSTLYFSIFSLSFKHQCLLHVSSFKYLLLDLAGTCHFLYLDVSLKHVAHLSLVLLFTLCTWQVLFRLPVSPALTSKPLNEKRSTLALLLTQEKPLKAGFLT